MRFHSLPLAAIALTSLASLPARLPAQTPPSTTTTQTSAGGPGFFNVATGASAGAMMSSVPVHQPGVMFSGFEHVAPEMESVTYLGVETTRVAPALSAQLNLQEGTGLVVTSTEAGSPAAGVFKPHDILLKLDDQILIVQAQLSVLIRGHKEGDEVAIAYVRGGKPATARVKLGKHDAPKLLGLFDDPGVAGGFVAFGPGGGMSFGGMQGVAVPAPAMREEADRLLQVMPRGLGPETMIQTRIENHGAPGVRAMSIDAGNSKVVYSEAGISLELTVKQGEKSLIAHGAKNEELFNGPVTTEEQRKNLPPEVRTRLEKLESMQGATFHTDGQFNRVESKVAVPKRPSI